VKNTPIPATGAKAPRRAGARSVPATVRELLRDLNPDAQWLLVAASVFREPVPLDALPECGPAGPADLIAACAVGRLVISDNIRKPPTVGVGAAVAAEVLAQLSESGRDSLIAAAHRYAASYWQWRATALAQDWQQQVHDLIEARHHLIEAQDSRAADRIAEDVCSRLHAFGSYSREMALIGDVLARVPADSPSRTGWAYRLAKACHLQADDEAAEHWFRQALAGFEKAGDAHGAARCYGYLGSLAHARGDYAAAEDYYLKSQGSGQSQFASPLASAPSTPSGPSGPSAPEFARLAGDAWIAEVPDSADAHEVTAVKEVARTPASDFAAGRRRLVALGCAASAALVVVAVLAVVTPAGRGPAPSPGPALARAAAVRGEAAAWIARWGAADTIVSCDPLMCAALRAHGVPAARILQITPGTADPLGSDLVAATSAVRGRFGRRLGAVYAPAVLASFGAGSTRIDIRVVALGGAASYRRQLRGDLAARRLGGTALLGNPAISVTATAARQLASGQVDSRLLITLAALAVIGPVKVIAFGGRGPGASQGMPLRSADITSWPVRSSRLAAVARHALADMAQDRFIVFLRAQRPPLLAAGVSERRLAAGTLIVRIEFAAPSPLGLLGVTAPAGPAAARRPARPRASPAARPA
jgi:hypothetical protein